MEFRILGPLEVRGEDGPLPLGGTKQRAVLALLLLNANRVVSRERLIDALWGEEPPETAVTTIQVYISRLRKLFPAETLVTRGRGYVLEVEPEAIDLIRFETLVADARSAESGDAARLLRDALSLWRGVPLAEFDEPFAQIERSELEDLRLAALERRLEADLALGRDADLVAELETLIGEHPHRERLRGQLMLALYRSGRQAEALGAYRDARAALGELGIEPGQELRRFEKRILTQDPGLVPKRRAHNLPVQPTPLIGRTRELADLRELIHRSRLVTLTGAGGSGKTRLALEAAAGLVEEFRDGVWFVSLATLTDPDLVEPTIGQSLGARGDLNDFLRGKSVLLLLDNLEQLLPGVAPTVARLEGKVLATSRERLNVLAEQEYPLPTLPVDDAVALFVQRARQLQPRFEVDEDVPEIARRLDGLPLALELAAARVKVLTPRQIVERLGHSLDLLADGATDRPERQRTLRTTIEWSYGLLTREEQRLFARLAVFVGGCTVEAAEQVAGADLDTLQSLVDKSLLRQALGRHWMLETVREYATERLDESGERDQLWRWLSEYLLVLVDRDMTPAERTRLALVLHEELGNLRGAMAPLLESGQTTVALRLATMAGFFNATAAEQIRWLDDALRNADEMPEILYLGAFSARAWAAWVVGDFEATARFGERALEGYRRLGVHNEESRVLRGLANAASSSGDFDRARTLLEQALQAAALSGDRRLSSIALHAIAELERELGNLDAAAELFSRGAEEARKVGDRVLLMYILHGMGDLSLARNDLTRAEASYRRSLQLSIELEELRTPPWCIAGLAAVAARCGHSIQSGELWGGVETLERELGFPLLPRERKVYERLISEHVDTASAPFGAAVERGRGMSVSDIYAHALSDS